MIRATLWSFLRSVHGVPHEQAARPLEHAWRILPVRLRWLSGALHGFWGKTTITREGEKRAPAPTVTAGLSRTRTSSERSEYRPHVHANSPPARGPCRRQSLLGRTSGNRGTQLRTVVMGAR